ncbi:MAG: ferrochelatase [Candidatus Heimdallarchaeota archaeon]|nr:ferrochelatase [Candidatus Heimdallarchaeota archaeon]
MKNSYETTFQEYDSLGKIGIVLLNMGGPENQEAIKPFLYNLFADPDLINLPGPLKLIQKPLAKFISSIRFKTTSSMYEAIGGGSPIRTITESLADKLHSILEERKISNYCCVAMRYTSPRASEVIDNLIEQKVDTIVLLSQYPHYSRSTTGSSIKEFKDALLNFNSSKFNIIIIDEWGCEDVYTDWWVDQIKITLRKLDLKISKDIHLVFSAHGLPQSYIDKGEKYTESLEFSKSIIMNSLGDIGYQMSHHLSYQSKAGPFPWTKPYTEDLLEELALQSPKAVIVIPLGFVSNHVETLYEIDILYKNFANSLGIPIFERVALPDDDDLYAASLADMLLSRVSGSTTEEVFE